MLICEVKKCGLKWSFTDLRLLQKKNKSALGSLWLSYDKQHLEREKGEVKINCSLFHVFSLFSDVTVTTEGVKISCVLITQGKVARDLDDSKESAQ